jgi:hypothetical protein
MSQPLTKHRADNHALFIGQDRRVDGPGDMVLGKLQRSSRVDNLIEIVAMVECDMLILHESAERRIITAWRFLVLARCASTQARGDECWRGLDATH